MIKFELYNQPQEQMFSVHYMSVGEVLLELGHILKRYIHKCKIQ